jgi:hypothetical protein
MAILVFVFSLLLLAAGLASGYMSLDLLPTSLGVLYALSGAVAVALAIVAFALGVLIRRIDALAKLVPQPVALLAAEPGAAALAPLEAGPLPAQVFEEPASAETESVARAAALAEDAEDPINENRAGHLPTLGAIEPAFETPHRSLFRRRRQLHDLRRRLDRGRNGRRRLQVRLDGRFQALSGRSQG